MHINISTGDKLWYCAADGRNVLRGVYLYCSADE